jgi:ABC-type transport system involved in cytochrome c biogenesis permease subunit
VGWRWRWPEGTLLASLLGALFLLLAQSFGMDGDTMPVLVAVLDSNFWLTIHVLTITVGYAGVVAAGAAAHWHLLKLRKGARDGAGIVHGLLAFGLVFTFVGTLLGGIWADQSWGRFWGWDPKENGALMIALWAGILFHARASGQVGVRGFSVGAVLGIATVLFAWFGVNMLGVGLHSYGFTQGTLWGLGSYAVLEAGFLAWVLRSPGT